MEVTWSDFDGHTGAGQAVIGTDQTGSFWFFDPGNVELVVEGLDSRGLNGHFWVFYASLTNVAYTPDALTVTRHRHPVRIYNNPLGHFGSAASHDGGATWRSTGGPQTYAVHRLIPDPVDPHRLYATTSDGNWVLQE